MELNSIRKTKAHCSSSTHGFTLIELLVVVAISGIVMAAIYSAYYTAQKNAIVQEGTAVMRQNLRAGLDLMAREIRMAGYDPTGTANAGITTAGSNSIAFADDLNGDHDTSDPGEQITYALSGNNLVRNDGDGTGDHPVAENIDALNFAYLDSAGNVTANLNEIRSVQITLVAWAEKEDRDYTDTQSYSSPWGVVLAAQNDHFRRRLLTTRVVCRNLGL